MQTTTLLNEELVALCRSGGESAGAAARDQLVSNLSGMVQSIVSTYTPVGILTREDLGQEGYSGLLEAIATYDADKAASFSTHAHRYIRGAVSRSIAKNSRTVKVSQRAHYDRMRSAARGDEVNASTDHTYIPFDEAEDAGMLDWGLGRRVPPHPGCE